MEINYGLKYLKTIATILPILYFLVTPCISVSAADTSIVSVSTPTEPISSGSQFTVSIEVQPDTAIAGAQFQLSFDPSLVTVNDITEGNLLIQDGASTYFSSGQINNDTGEVTGVVGAIISAGQTVSSEGTFAIITMTAGSSQGTSSLDLSNVVLGNMAGELVSSDVINGQISINHILVLDSIGNKDVNVGSDLTFTVSASGSDDDSLIYSASNLPSGASFSVSSHTFSWTPSLGQVGSYDNVYFEVTDGSVTSTQEITITVNKVTPTFNSLSSPSINLGVAATNLGGTIQYGSLVPSGDVSITLNGVTQNAAIDASGNFSSSFTTDTLTTSSSPYSINYAYSGDDNFNALSDDTTTLTVVSSSKTKSKSSGGGGGSNASTKRTSTEQAAVLATSPTGLLSSTSDTPAPVPTPAETATEPTTVSTDMENIEVNSGQIVSPAEVSPVEEETPVADDSFTIPTPESSAPGKNEIPVSEPVTTTFKLSLLIEIIGGAFVIYAIVVSIIIWRSRRLQSNHYYRK